MKATQFILTIFCVLTLLLPAVSFAADTEALERQIQNLARQLQELQLPFDAQKSELQAQKENQEEVAEAATALRSIAERVTISGFVEVEAGFSEDYDDNDESDITLATVELGIDVDLHQYVSGHLLLLWEEDDTEPVDLDEAFITLGNTEYYPLYLSAGKFYVPFGNFSSCMISDPLTLELGETRETAVLVGLDYQGFYAGAYTFNGDIDETGDEDKIKGYGLNAGYTYETEDFAVDFGLGWINSIADSDALGEFLEEEGIEDIADYVGGFNAYAIVSWKNFTLIGEYLGATDDFKMAELEFAGSGAQPESWNIELAYTFEVAGHETVLAAAYQGTDEAHALELPEKRYLGSLGVELVEGVSVALEYAHDEDYGESEGGSGENAETVTMQLALEF
ncbi:MAG: LbtU family siderophore porin [Deltaproteobacteria bacterium]|nr:LbtU family siderophore porin [Candidatus Anaeroferrophillus wilburensis]MBN2889409.1 LbtU family siderophore porin [Deltaproteobacteria bacterium]